MQACSMPYSAAVVGAAVEHVARQCISCATAEAAAHEAASLLLVPVQHGICLSLAGCLMHVRSMTWDVPTFFRSCIKDTFKLNSVRAVQCPLASATLLGVFGL
jgi:hypothetical protein